MHLIVEKNMLNTRCINAMTSLLKYDLEINVFFNR